MHERERGSSSASPILFFCSSPWDCVANLLLCNVKWGSSIGIVAEGCHCVWTKRNGLTQFLIIRSEINHAADAGWGCSRLLCVASCRVTTDQWLRSPVRRNSILSCVLSSLDLHMVSLSIVLLVNDNISSYRLLPREKNSIKKGLHMYCLSLAAKVNLKTSVWTAWTGHNCKIITSVVT